MKQIAVAWDERMPRLQIVVGFLVLLLPLLGCNARSDRERTEARQALKRLSIPYNREALVEHLRSGDPLIVDLFMAAGMDPDVRDTNGVTPLMRFAMEGNVDAVQRLIAKGAEVNAKDNTGDTALMGGAGYGRTAIVQLLVEKRADVNAQANDGGTALIQATLNSYPAIVKLLIDHGANVNAKTKSGRTALSYAEEKNVGFLGGEGRPEVVTLLKQAGARE